MPPKSLDQINTESSSLQTASTLYEAAEMVNGAINESSEQGLAEAEEILRHRFQEEIDEIYPESRSTVPYQRHSQSLMHNVGDRLSPTDANVYERYKILQERAFESIAAGSKELESSESGILGTFTENITAATEKAIQLQTAAKHWRRALHTDIFNTCYLAQYRPESKTLTDILGLDRIGLVPPEIILDLYDAIETQREVIPVPYYFGAYDDTGTFYNDADIIWALHRQLKALDNRYQILPIQSDNLDSLLRRTRAIFEVLKVDSDRESPIANAVISAHGNISAVALGDDSNSKRLQAYQQPNITSEEADWLKKYFGINKLTKFIPKNLTFLSCQVGDISQQQEPFAAAISKLGITVKAAQENVRALDLVAAYDTQGNLSIQPIFANEQDEIKSSVTFKDGRQIATGSDKDAVRNSRIRRALILLEMKLNGKLRGPKKVDHK